MQGTSRVKIKCQCIEKLYSQTVLTIQGHHDHTFFYICFFYMYSFLSNIFYVLLLIHIFYSFYEVFSFQFFFLIFSIFFFQYPFFKSSFLIVILFFKYYFFSFFFQWVFFLSCNLQYVLLIVFCIPFHLGMTQMQYRVQM